MRERRGGSVVLGGLLLVMGAGCSQQAPAADGSTRSMGSVINRSKSDTTAPAPPDTVLPRLVRLEQEARALASTRGCTGVEGCRTAPVGWRGCGGPRDYVVYCAATTDTVALFRKLKELEDAERAYNAATGMASTCEMRLPPGVRFSDRRCRAASTGDVNGPNRVP